ncbi:hypothetical protein AB0M46_17770 [Dactylosporangium sp. NPDC051485]|uniref:hypothetical protein n=1 Tax=Dactylosporangium sp. NPDC051485 TaxID=3154846 RepID=UPI003417E720
MSVPAEVYPSAPSGLQNAPGCTLPTGPAGGFVVVFTGAGFVVVFTGAGFVVVFPGAGFVVVFPGAGTAGSVVGSSGTLGTTVAGLGDGESEGDGLGELSALPLGSAPTTVFGLAGGCGAQAASAATARSAAIQRRASIPAS